MQIAVIITPLGLEPPDMRAGSICGKVRSFKSTQTENVERRLGPGNQPIRRRYGYMALADDRLVFAYPTMTTARRRNRRVYPAALQSM
jgi:hypothetical protein